MLVTIIEPKCGVFSVLSTLLEPSCVSEVFVVTLVTPVLEKLTGVQVSSTFVVIVILGDLTCGTFETEMLGDEVVLHTVEVRLTLASFSLIFGISLSFFLPLSQVLVLILVLVDLPAFEAVQMGDDGFLDRMVEFRFNWFQSGCVMVGWLLRSREDFSFSTWIAEFNRASSLVDSLLIS